MGVVRNLEGRGALVSRDQNALFASLSGVSPRLTIVPLL
jgi:hypothetical protein